ncbi:MAG: hypothetical protein EBU23_16065, partial [Mycobacteriaceae bacterium]|nr:hypothetical protein [Mycobacteriaceae bacterium]
MVTGYDAVGRAAADAAPALLRDRARYRPFFEAAERYAAEVGMFVGGGAAVKMLTQAAPAPPALDDYAYDFYSPHGSAHARGLADRLFAADPELGRYTALVTNVPGYHWVALVDGRRLFTVTALPVRAGARTAGLVAGASVARPGLFGAAPALATLGYELALVDAYRALCAPTKLGDLGAALAAESALRAAMLQEAPWAGSVGQASPAGGASAA